MTCAQTQPISIQSAFNFWLADHDPQQSFTTEDFHNWYDHQVRAGEFISAAGNGDWGTLTSVAAKRGLIVFTGICIRATRIEAKGHLMMVWRKAA